MSHECPRCRRVDSVAKVSAIVAGGVWYTRDTKFNIGPSFSPETNEINLAASLSQTSSRSQTDLSKKLSHSEMDEGWGCNHSAPARDVASAG